MTNDETLQNHLDNLWATNRQQQNEAYNYIMEITREPVDWAYDIWETAVQNLTHQDNHHRAIAAQLLCNLAKSDPDHRILNDFPALLAVTRDERFVTARHCLQNLWKIGRVSPTHQQMVLDGLSQRFEDCQPEKNHTLIRYDISVGLRSLYDATQSETIKSTALALIETEADPKYKKKYAKAWKGA